MRLFARSVGIGAVSLLAIQFIPAHRYNPAVKGDLVARPAVKAALQGACYDSHPETTRRKLNEIARFVASGDMAPWYYRALHPDARLSDLQRRLIVSWA